jgi:hypothetical protein
VFSFLFATVWKIMVILGLFLYHLFVIDVWQEFAFLSHSSISRELTKEQSFSFGNMVEENEKSFEVITAFTVQA